MAEVILDNHIPLILAGIFAVLGVAGKLTVSVALKRLARAAGNMSKSAHPLIRLVRAKFEHACMISDRVQNVEVFVEKYLYEYKIAGLRLHSLRRMESGCAWLCLIAGVLGALIEYSLYGITDRALKMGAAGAGLTILLVLVYMTTDEKYLLEVVKNYMVDYLENVCAHRYEKSMKREMKLTAPPEMAPEVMNRRSQFAKNTEPEMAGEREPAPEIVNPDISNPEIENPQRPRPRREVPSPQDSPEVTPPVMPMPGRASEDAAQAPAFQEKEMEAVPVQGKIVSAKAGDMQTGKKGNAKSAEEKEHKPISKEVLIRQILEEFLT